MELSRRGLILGGLASVAVGCAGTAMPLADGAEGWITVHPSYLLRLPDAAKAAEERARFVAELRVVGERVRALA